MVSKAFVLVSVLSSAGFAQVAAGQPNFEAAAMRASDPSSQEQMSCTGGPGTSDPGRFVCRHAPLGMLLAIAYDVQFYSEVGPEWMNSGGYDINAKIPPNTTRSQMKLMVQNLLADRLRLAVRWETRETEGLSLVVKSATKQPAIHLATPLLRGANAGMATSFVDDHRHLIATRQKMSDLAGYISVQLGRAVTDETGLTGDYDFTLDYWPSQNSAPSPSGVPEIPAAIQDQLGLKLESKMRPAKFLVVDHAERVPTEN